MMKALVGDTVVDDDRDIGIIESRERNVLTIRYPARGNQRFRKTRDQVQHLAERIRQARLEGKPLQVGVKISLTGDSTLAELVGLFGYSTGQLRGESLWKVRKQLERAGLETSTPTGNWSRDDRFRINLQGEVAAVEPVEDPGEEPVADVGSPDAIEGAVRAGKPETFHVDQISADPLPSGHTSRRWGTAIKRADGTVAIELDPWEG